jgi:hypothetical protein
VAAAALGREGASEDRAQRIGLLLSAMRDDAYPAVRGIAWRSLRALVPASGEVGAFTSTDDSRLRAASIDAIRARASERGEAITLPDAALASELRARASERAIEIGE